MMDNISGHGEWIQVDLKTPKRVVAVVTQGFNSPMKLNEWVTSYKISYGNNTNSMQVIQNEQGNDEASFSLLLFFT